MGWARRLRATIERSFAPGYGWCYRCRRPWKFAKAHYTDYEEVPGGWRGCFPLCESCWQGLAIPDARLPYYATLHARWRPGYAEWNDIEAAVRAGR